MSSTMPQPEAAPILACTVSRDVQNFDLLIEDMESAMGETWGDLGFAEAIAFFGQPEAADLEFVALAIDAEDEENLVMLTEIVTQAKMRDVAVILIAEDVSPPTLHALMRHSSGEFVPYPLPEAPDYMLFPSSYHHHQSTSKCHFPVLKLWVPMPCVRSSKQPRTTRPD